MRRLLRGTVTQGLSLVEIQTRLETRLASMDRALHVNSKLLQRVLRRLKIGRKSSRALLAAGIPYTKSRLLGMRKQQLYSLAMALQITHSPTRSRRWFVKQILAAQEARARDEEQE